MRTHALKCDVIMENKPETQVEEEIVVEEEAPVEEAQADETEAESEKPLQTDYKAEYEKLQKRVAADAFKFRQSKKEDRGDDSGDEPDDDKPLTRSEVAKLLAEEKASISKQLTVKEATTLASKLTSNDDEAQYAVALWQNVQLPFDSMEEQLEFIVGGMNAKRVLAQNAELKRALLSKDTARKNTATTARDAMSAGQPKIDPQVASVLKTQGYTYNSNQKVYTKKLADGRTMYNNGKGKTWVQ